MVMSKQIQQTAEPKQFSEIKIKKRKKMTASRIFSLLLLIVVSVSILYPLVWMVISSMKTYEEIYNNVWGIPAEWQIQNYAIAWEKGIAQYFINSIIVTTTTIVSVLVISSMAAFALVKYRSRFVDWSLLFIMIGMMLNPQIALIPLYTMLNNFGLINTPWALILPYISFRLPLSILLIRSYFMSIPKELEESAVMDGCTDLKIFAKIYLPMARPILTTVTVLTAYFAWNEFMFATIFISSENYKTIPSGLMNFRDALQTDWGVLLAGMVISAIPMIILLIFSQKYLMRGMTDGSVKG